MLCPGAFTGISTFILLAGICLPGVICSATTLKPLAAGKGGVVATGHPLVAEAGLRILEKGGNAVDKRGISLRSLVLDEPRTRFLTSLGMTG